MKCQTCGKPMEMGYLGVASNELTPPEWFKKKSKMGLGGEKLAPGLVLFSGIRFFEGGHCRGCRIITIRY